MGRRTRTGIFGRPTGPDNPPAPPTRLVKPAGFAEPAVGANGLRALDLVFVLDATGSMQPWIDQVRKVLRQVVAEVAASPARPDLRLALVEYRDHPGPGTRGPAAKVTPAATAGFVPGAEQLTAQLARVICSGGDDEPEAMVDGVQTGLALPFRTAAQKVCVVMADAPAHGFGAPNDWYPRGCPCGRELQGTVRDGVNRLGAVVHAVAVSSDPHARRTLQTVAELGGGEFFGLTDTSRLVHALTRVVVLESGKVATDLDVAARWSAAGGDLARIAAETGKSPAEVSASVARLRAKASIESLPVPDSSAPPAPGPRVRFRP